MPTIMIVVLVGVILLLTIGVVLMTWAFFQRVQPGTALLISKVSVADVVFEGGAVVLPIVHKAETMSLAVQTIELDRRKADGLICKDSIRADVNATFFVRVNRTKEDVLKVAQSIGTERAADPETVRQLFQAKFVEALKTAAGSLNFMELYSRREAFRDVVIQIIGRDLNGYRLDDMAIDYLEQTPIEHLDPNNVVDAAGMERIKELTGAEVLQGVAGQGDQKSTDSEEERILSPPSNVDPNVFLPALTGDVQSENAQFATDTDGLNISWLSEGPALIVTLDGQPSARVALDQPFQVKLSRQGKNLDHLGVTVRQKRNGFELSIRLRLSPDDLVDSATDGKAAGEAMAGLPRQDFAAPALVSGAVDLLGLLAHFTRVQGGSPESWT